MDGVSNGEGPPASIAASRSSWALVQWWHRISRPPVKGSSRRALPLAPLRGDRWRELDVEIELAFGLRPADLDMTATADPILLFKGALKAPAAARSVSRLAERALETLSVEGFLTGVPLRARLGGVRLAFHRASRSRS